MKFLYFFISLLLIALLALFSYSLFFPRHQALSSTLIGEPIPTFQLPDIVQPQKIFTQRHLRNQVCLLNVWATWCSACELEHDMLMKISQQYHIPIYGIAYRDQRENVLIWLKMKGNPYVLIGDDKNGDTAIDFGVYGTPETFIINAEGKIVYRHIGVITQEIWDSVLYPQVRSYL